MSINNISNLISSNNNNTTAIRNDKICGRRNRKIFKRQGEEEKEINALEGIVGNALENIQKWRHRRKSTR